MTELLTRSAWVRGPLPIEELETHILQFSRNGSFNAALLLAEEWLGRAERPPDLVRPFMISMIEQVVLGLQEHITAEVGQEAALGIMTRYLQQSGNSLSDREIGQLVCLLRAAVNGPTRTN